MARCIPRRTPKPIPSLVICAALIVTTFVGWSRYIRAPRLIQHSGMVEVHLDATAHSAPRPTMTTASSVLVYDLQQPASNDEFDCVTLRTKPATPICVYNNTDLLSRTFRRSGIYEEILLNILQTYLRNDRNLGFIDIGANLGYYSLIAAKMGHQVISVEPLISNVKRFHKAAILGNTTSKITLLQNGIGNRREVLPISVSAKNVGGSTMKDAAGRCRAKGNMCEYVRTILLRDIAPFVKFTKAVMKMDIEGFEQRAFTTATGLFSQVDIPVVTMEMWNIKKHCAGKETEDRRMMKEMFRFLTEAKYHAYPPGRRGRLDPARCRGWPFNVVWVREDYKYPPTNPNV